MVFTVAFIGQLQHLKVFWADKALLAVARGPSLPLGGLWSDRLVACWTGPGLGGVRGAAEDELLRSRITDDYGIIVTAGE
jgi:hypothetical protein